MAQIGKTLFLPPLHGGRKIPYGEHARQTLDAQLRHLPPQLQYCTRCVVSNQRPRIIFDEEGVCGACRWAEEKETKVNWADRKRQFEDMLARFRRTDGHYDVIVPTSGGKDSGAIAHKLKYEYGMNPLTITWSPLLYTEVGFQNLQSMISSGLASRLYTPNRIVQRKISKLGLVLVGNHFEAFGRGQMSYAFHVALQEGVKLVMFGENGELEYGGSLKDKDRPGRAYEDFDELYHKGAAISKTIDFGVEHGYLTADEARDPSIKLYTYPPVDALYDAKIEMHWFGYYHKWIPQENYYYVAEHYRFAANPEGHSEGTYSKYASLDDLTDPPHYYMAYIKFGLGRATSDAAHEIRDGHLTREEGVALVKRYDHVLPTRYHKEFLAYLDITDEDWWEIVDAYRSPHLWEESGGEWKPKFGVS